MALSGSDRIETGLGNDVVQAGVGRDVVIAGDGRDRIDAGGGNDRLIGGLGADTFVFAGRAGSDVVVDFDRGVDRLDLPAGRPQVIDEDAGARVRFAGGSVLLLGVDAAELTADLFI